MSGDRDESDEPDSRASGSRWFRWDPHIHAPGTVLNDKFGDDDPLEEFLTRLEASNPPIAAIGVTDYYSTETYRQVIEAKGAGRLTPAY